MSLLREVQDAASDSRYPIQDLLKKCLILSARLDHAPLRDWATQELNGYATGAELPEYRRLHVGDVRANIILGFQHATNVSIAKGAVPDDIRDVFYTAEVHQAIAGVQDLVTSGEELGIMVDAGMANHIVQRMYDDDLAGALSMRRIVGRSQFVALIDTVRTRILQFALEIEKLNPEAGEIATGASPLPRDQVQHVYNTTILGGATNVAVGSTDVTQIASEVNEGDWESLQRALAALGIPMDELTELQAALVEDSEGGLEGGVGDRTEGWLGRILTKARSGALVLAGGVGVEVVTDLILKYLGLDT